VCNGLQRSVWHKQPQGSFKRTFSSVFNTAADRPTQASIPAEEHQSTEPCLASW
jgi:hypothetical protein